MKEKVIEILLSPKFYGEITPRRIQKLLGGDDLVSDVEALLKGLVAEGLLEYSDKKKTEYTASQRLRIAALEAEVAYLRKELILQRKTPEYQGEMSAIKYNHTKVKNRNKELAIENAKLRKQLDRRDISDKVFESNTLGTILMEYFDCTIDELLERFTMESLQLTFRGNIRDTYGRD